MAFLKSFAAGVLGAALAALIWIVIAYSASSHAAGMALLVGLAAGLGVRKVSKADTRWQPGLAAALSALVVVPFTQGFVVELTDEPPPDDFFDSVPLVSEELMIAYVADNIALEWEAEGRSLNWPRDITWEDAVFREDYPLDLWAVASDEWHAMSTEAQQRLMDEREEKAGALRDRFSSQFHESGARHQTAGASLVWFVLAVLLAIGAAAGHGT